MRNTFRGGIHPRERFGGKAVTGKLPVEVMPAPAQVAILLSQHVGAPCKSLVKAGDRVLLGQKIGEPAGFMGAPVHASVSGTVKGIVTRTMANGVPGEAILIDNDFQDEAAEPLGDLGDPLKADPAALLARIRECGCVGLGGACFPTQVKLSPPADKPIDTVILNGAECEPYLTGDHRAMLEKSGLIADGLRLAMYILGAKRGVVAVEDNKPDAAECMAAAVREIPGASMRLVKAKYPQGGEKQLIKVITGREVPSGKLPMDAGCVVMNVSSAAAVSEAIREGRPLIERVMTVSGLVERPANLRVRIGTSIGEVLEYCGGVKGEPNRLILGGPMMGLSGYDLTTPVAKGTSGLVLLRDETPEHTPIGNCIRCGTCVTACPMHLMPLELSRLAEKGDFEACRREHALDCIECGSCSYGCPAKLPLVHNIRVAKRFLARRR